MKTTVTEIAPDVFRLSTFAPDFGIQFVQFDDRDVVRHSLVQKIVKAYERYNEVIGVNRQLSLRLAEPAPEAGSRDAGLAEPASPQFPVA